MIYEKWIWKIIDFLNIFSKKEFEIVPNKLKNKNLFGYDIVGIIDTTEIRINRPRDQFYNNFFYSSYKK